MCRDVGGQDHFANAVENVHVLLAAELLEDVAFVHAQNGHLEMWEGEINVKMEEESIILMTDGYRFCLFTVWAKWCLSSTEPSEL